MVAQSPEGFGIFVTVGGNHAAIAHAAKILSRIETKCGNIAQASRRALFVLRSVRLRSVLDDRQLGLFGNPVDLIDVCRLSIEMNDNYRFCFIRYCGSDAIWIRVTPPSLPILLMSERAISAHNLYRTT